MPMDDPMTEMSPLPQPVAPRYLRIALVLSLSVNLLVAGLVAGAVLRGGQSPEAVRDLGFGPFAAALSEDDRKALRQAYMLRAVQGGDTRRAMAGNMQALVAALRADPFNPEAARDLMQQASDRLAKRIDLGMSLLFDLIAGMPEAARLDFADRLATELRHGAKRRGKLGSGQVPPAP